MVTGMAEHTTPNTGQVRLQWFVIHTCAQPGEEDTACPGGPHGSCSCEHAGPVGGWLCNDEKVGCYLLVPAGGYDWLVGVTVGWRGTETRYSGISGDWAGSPDK